MFLSNNDPENETWALETKREQDRFGSIALAVATALLTAFMGTLVYAVTALP